MPLIARGASNSAEIAHKKYMATNLYEYYTSQGQNLPSVQERAVIYEQKGLGKASDYKGTASQNTQLLGALNPKQMAGNKPTVSPVTITGDIAEGKIKEATKGIEKIKIEPSKPKTYDEQLQEIATTGETLESDFLKEINNIRKGNIKYTADEQAQLDFITQSIANAQNAQEKFNRQAERGTRLLSVGEFAPVRQQSALNQTIQSGLDEIKNINLEGAAKLGEARQAIRDKRFDEIVKTYGELNAMQDRRSKIIQQLRDNAMELEKFEYQKMKDQREWDLDSAIKREQLAQLRAAKNSTPESSEMDKNSDFKKLKGNAELKQALDAYKKAVEEQGARKDKNPNAAILKEKYGAVLQAYRAAVDLGALQGSDVQLVDDAIKKATYEGAGLWNVFLGIPNAVRKAKTRSAAEKSIESAFSTIESNNARLQSIIEASNPSWTQTPYYQVITGQQTSDTSGDTEEDYASYLMQTSGGGAFSVFED